MTFKEKHKSLVCFRTQWFARDVPEISYSFTFSLYIILKTAALLASSPAVVVLLVKIQYAPYVTDLCILHANVAVKKITLLMRAFNCYHKH